jgi:hypothetical protein
VGGDPLVGTAVLVNGMDNTFEGNRYDTAVRFSFGTTAFGNKIKDSQESSDRTYLTVSTKPSRGDFVGSDQNAIQAALDAASIDPNINKVVLGKGMWTLASTLDVPAGITLEGSGYDTHLLGTGVFPAITLASGGKQTIKGIRFNTFSDSVVGPATGVFVYGNWLESAPVNVNVLGATTMNI